MTERERLIQLLVTLVLDGVITEEVAEQILDAYDKDGTLPLGWVLPLPLDEAIPLNLVDLVNEAVQDFFTTLRVSPDAAEDDFIRIVTNLAEQLGRGTITLSQWHSEMVNELIIYLAEQAQTGAQRVMTEDELDGLYNATLFQLLYLTRFADMIATGRQSSAQVESRSILYAGEGRAQWYEKNGATNAMFGWVVDYIAVDDKNTCGPCANAEANGPYLPNDASAPLPGRICRGRGYCRCVRLLRYDPEVYTRLSGLTA